MSLPHRVLLIPECHEETAVLESHDSPVNGIDDMHLRKIRLQRESDRHCWSVNLPFESVKSLPIARLHALPLK